MYVSDEYSELGQEIKNGLVIDPPRFCKNFQNLAPMAHIISLLFILFEKQQNYISHFLNYYIN